jgi:hypothetical protein
VAWWGTPSARPIKSQELAPYRKEVADFLKAKAATPQVAAADATMRDLLTGQCGLHPLAIREADRIHRDGVEAREALEIVGGVWLYAHRHPHRLPDDDRLTLHLGYSLIAARPRPYRVKVGRTGRTWHNVNKITATPRREVGMFVRNRLGIFWRRVFEAMDAKHQRIIETNLALQQPFAE